MEKRAESVVVDSPLWIEFLSLRRNPDTKEIERLIKADRIRLAGPILYEVLIGPRDEGQRQYLQSRMRAFPMLAASDAVWLKAVELGRLESVAKKKVPASDVFIAAHAQTYLCALFTRDRHYDVFPGLKRHQAGSV